MALFKHVPWAFIFITRLRFAPGSSIATIASKNHAKILEEPSRIEDRYNQFDTEDEQLFLCRDLILLKVNVKK